MALKYIYTLLQSTASGKVEVLNSTTQKWALTKYVEKEFIKTGLPVSALSVARVKDGLPDTMTYIDIYDFMEVDPGEE